MKLNPVKLQEVVDKMSTQLPDGTWELDHSYAPEFFEMIEEYLLKAATKSDQYDPENTFGELRIGMWKALEAYGPRPKGNMFSEYTLKLKTNNILTNLHKKRESDKALLNYPGKKKRKLLASVDQEITVVSLDEMNEKEQDGKRVSGTASCDPIDLCELKETIKEELLIRSNKRKQKKFSLSTILKHVDRLSEENKKVLFYELVGGVLGKPTGEITNVLDSFFDQISFFTELRDKLYYRNKETAMVDTENLGVGDKLVTKKDKIIEIRGKTEYKNKDNDTSSPGFRVLILSTGKEIAIPVSYIKDFVDRVFVAEEIVGDLVEQSIESVDVVEEETTQNKKVFFDTPIVENKLRVSAVDVLPEDVLLKSGTTKNNEEKNVDNKKGDKVRLLVKLLQEGEQTRDTLAQAMIDGGLSKTGSLEKEKNYVSVMLNTVKKSGKYKFAPPKRGAYRILE